MAADKGTALREEGLHVLREAYIRSRKDNRIRIRIGDLILAGCKKNCHPTEEDSQHEPLRRSHSVLRDYLKIMSFDDWQTIQLLQNTENSPAQQQISR